ncbi:hypothetical protein PSDVSF_29440 [Pseudodesulfovibrio sediminis]|uniref:Uncharacterized protein n=1 Tax=Pseudodesulfovibrio sediminis TaxID=2810563 RepID=A0ABN6EW57_9BACT|nr:hypothetical protein PSDVSF_29440 [Pseudodesulfovibrio sediminis]
MVDSSWFLVRVMVAPTVNSELDDMFSETLFFCLSNHTTAHGEWYYYFFKSFCA